MLDLGHMEEKPLPSDQKSAETNRETVSLDDFCSLGNRLLEENLYEEAVALYQTANKIFPDSLVIRLNLGRAQELQHKKSLEQQKGIKQTIIKEREREDLAAQCYLSLATLYYTRRKLFNAIELLELSKHKNENISKTRFLLGKIFYEQGEVAKALEEFTKARDLDPFYEDIYKHLGNLYYEKQNYEKALESFVDAHILSGGEDVAKASYYQRQIRTVLNDLKIEDKKDYYNRIFNERKEYFQNLAGALTVRKDGTFSELAEGLEPILLRFREMERAAQTSLNLARELRKSPVAQGLTDEELLQLGRITTERVVKKDEVIFREEDLTEGIYFVQRGSVRILKPTPFGEQVLASLESPEFFGEMDFIDSLRCSADAVANEDSALLSVSKVKLEELFISQKHIAVRFYWQFWKTLAQRIRDANELLKSFFIEAAKDEKRMALEGTAGKTVSVDLDKKMAVLKEKGLSSKELRLLATFSNEEFYKAGQSIFVEGQKGDKLYILLDGEVRISKFIPGVGEEALAILGKGDFFGEMALIDNAPRSADATAHSDTTVLPIENKLLTDILSRDVESSYQFLYILCKILSRRLREINLKIYQWRMMAGGF